MIREAALYQKAGFRVWQNGEIVGGVLIIATEQKQKKNFASKKHNRLPTIYEPFCTSTKSCAKTSAKEPILRLCCDIN